MEAYIAWLKEHPAVWGALQEEKKNLGWHPGDWFILTHKGEQEINCVGTMAQDRDWLAWVKEAGKYRDILWLPDLGQLVRMLVEACPKGLLELDSSLFTTSRAGGTDRNWSARIDKKQSLLGEEPEIACTALWAKAKGVE